MKCPRCQSNNTGSVRRSLSVGEAPAHDSTTYSTVEESKEAMPCKPLKPAQGKALRVFDRRKP